MIKDQNSLRREFRERFPRDHGQLLPALHFLHHKFGYLPDWGMEVLGWHLGIPVSEVYGAATSYSELRTEKPAEHVLRVCTGLACRQKGINEISKAISERLKALPGQTSTDGRFTFEETECGFLCGLAPAVELDQVWHGRATIDGITTLIEETG